MFLLMHALLYANFHDDTFSLSFFFFQRIFFFFFNRFNYTTVNFILFILCCGILYFQYSHFVDSCKPLACTRIIRFHRFKSTPFRTDQISPRESRVAFIQREEIHIRFRSRARALCLPKRTHSTLRLSARIRK